jgi:CspA family cold shock protein
MKWPLHRWFVRAIRPVDYAKLVPLRTVKVDRRLAMHKEFYMATGTVARIAQDKGFGFIRDDRGQEYFFHYSAVEGNFADLRVGQHVSFEEEVSPKGPRATNVRLA